MFLDTSHALLDNVYSNRLKLRPFGPLVMYFQDSSHLMPQIFQSFQFYPGHSHPKPWSPSNTSKTETSWALGGHFFGIGYSVRVHTVADHTMPTRGVRSSVAPEVLTRSLFRNNSARQHLLPLGKLTWRTEAGDPTQASRLVSSPASHMSFRAFLEPTSQSPRPGGCCVLRATIY